MITNICLLLEVLSLIFCLHALYGEKVKLDIATTSFLAVYMIIMTVLNYYRNLPPQFSMIIYPVMLLYCGVRFGFNIKHMLINMVLCVITVGGIQMAVMLLSWFLFRINWYTNYQLLILNGSAFLILMIFLSMCRINRITNYIHRREKIQYTVLVICVALIIYWLLSYKEFTRLELNQAILLFISIFCIFLLGDQLGKYKIKAKEAETELKMYELYADSFQGLIDNIRLRQHEYDNHINTIYSQHYTCKTYEKLVKAQAAYCKEVLRENRFNKLLSTSNSVITGFLYGKFMEIDKLGIDITYHVEIKELNVGFPVYKIIEILGDLLNNAVEAIEKINGVNGLYVSLVEGQQFEIEVRNESPFIDYDEIEKFFIKGFSKKGSDRGLGLYNVKKICSEYDLDIYCENIKIDETNWLSFKVAKKK